MQPRHQATLLSHENAFCSITSQTCTYLRTSQHQMTTIMQPFQCDLQPQIQETHRTTHTGTQEQPLVAEHRGGTKTTPAATAAHMRQLASPAAATLHGKTQGFVLRLPPHNTEHATFMQPFQCDLQPQIQEAHRTAHTGTQEQPLVAEHRGGTKTTPDATVAHTRYLSSPAAATLNETQGFVLRLPPHNTEHATFMQPF